MPNPTADNPRGDANPTDGCPHLSSQFTAHAFGMRQWHPNPGGDDSCLRYRQNVITGVVMVIVGVVWSVVLATRYCRNEVRASSRSRLSLRIDNSDRRPSVAALP